MLIHWFNEEAISCKSYPDLFNYMLTFKLFVPWGCNLIWK